MSRFELLFIPLLKPESLIMLKRKSHFMNSALSIPRTFSFALDSFLEIASCLFLPHLSNLTVTNEFTEPLFNTCSRYNESPETNKLFGRNQGPSLGLFTTTMPVIFS